MSRRTWDKESLIEVVITVAKELAVEPRQLTEKMLDAVCFRHYGIKYMNKNFENHFGHADSQGGGRFKAARQEAQRRWDTFHSDSSVEELMGQFTTEDELVKEEITPIFQPDLELDQIMGRKKTEFVAADWVHDKVDESNDVRAKPLIDVKISGEIFIVGDCHFPYVNRQRLRAIIAEIEKVKPAVVVQIGDVYDLYRFSSFAKDPNMLSPMDELDQGKKLLHWFWKTVRSIVPNAQLFQILGNHEDRIGKQISNKMPELCSLVSGKELLFEGLDEYDVFVCGDGRDYILINDVVYTHGWKTSGRLPHAEFFMKNTVIGHTHRGGLDHRSTLNGLLFELNAGYIADETSKPLGYSQSKVTGWIAGYGRIDAKGRPSFHPLP